MKHLVKHGKFGRDRDSRKALFRALITSLCQYGRIETTLSKAKAIKPLAEKLLTKAKKGTLASIRDIAGYVYTEDARKKLQEYAKLAEKRNGGYTRIYKKGPRLSDAAPMAIIEFVDKPLKKNEDK
ncbi:MAG: large subunit ribosomal protein L17 [Candidatus Deianiraeaceae bacterium]|jgi:large subunit ribosomal protein L17